MSDEKSHKFNLKRYFSVTIITSVLSQLSILFYYRRFGVQPLYYYEPYEIAIKVIKDCIPICLIFFIVTYTLVANISNIKIINRLQLPVYEGNAFSRHFSRFILFFILEGMAIIAITISYLFAPEAITSMECVLFIVLFFHLLIFNQDGLDNFKLNDPVEYSKMENFIPVINYSQLVIGSVLIFSACFISDVSSKVVVKRNKYIHSEFTLSTKEKIKITTKVILIGRSKEFLILYNSPSKSVRIVKRSDLIKEIIISKDTGTLSYLFSSY